MNTELLTLKLELISYILSYVWIHNIYVLSLICIPCQSKYDSIIL